ncbi:MAG: glutamate-cysteine ligase family protein [Pseudonocardiaceae bacterium]
MDRAAAEGLWLSFADRDPSWSTVREVVTGVITGVRRKSAGFVEHVDTDTGVCTVEVSLAPQETIDLAVNAANLVIRDLQLILEQMGYTLLCAGTQPRTWFDPARKTPKDWYLLLSRRLSFHHWFVPIASHQVSIDVTAEEAVRVVNVLCGFAGIFAGLTASSPIARGGVQPWKETRNWIWHERCKRIKSAEAAYTSNSIPMTPFFDTGAYVEYCWNSHLFFLTDLKSNGYEVSGGKSFRDLIVSRDPVMARRWDRKLVKLDPNREMLDRIHQYGWLAAKLHYMFDARTDLENVRAALERGRIGEYFEEHAVNCYVENRTCGVAPEGEEGLAAALTLGVVEQLDDAETLLRELEWNEWRRLWISASERGVTLNDAKALDMMRELVDLARMGLRARGAGEEQFLEPALARLELRETPADDMIRAFRFGGIRRLIEDFGRST